MGYKYYHNEKSSPFDKYPGNFFWTAEKAHSKGIDEDTFNALSSLYSNIGGELIDGVPYGLLITMFSLWSKGQYDLQSNIKDFHNLVKKW